MACSRILVVGSPGTGKSRIAAELGARLGLPVVHLDRLFHDPAHGYADDRPRWRRHVVEELVTQPRWVMDGHYASTLAQRIAAADLVVHLDHPTRTALRGVVARRWGRGQNRPDVPEGWRERVSWELLVSVLRFRSTERARIAELVAAAPHPPVVVRLGSRAEVRRWLQGVDGRPAADVG